MINYFFNGLPIGCAEARVLVGRFTDQSGSDHAEISAYWTRAIQDNMDGEEAREVLQDLCDGGLEIIL